MYISKFQVLNFKSFRDSGEVELKPGFNVVTGQNSAGKTALLEAMALRFEPNPNRSIRTIPIPGANPTELHSRVRATISLSRNDLFEVLTPNAQYFIPEPPQDFPIPGDGPYRPAQNKGRTLLDWLSHEDKFDISFNLVRDRGESWSAEGLVFGKYEPPTPSPNGTSQVLNFVFRNRAEFAFHSYAHKDWKGYVTPSICHSLRDRIYRFTAERFNVGQCGFGHSSMLASNAQNLPEVVNALTANPARLVHLNQLLREVLPQVRQVSVRPVPNNQVQLIVWTHDPETQRDDLAIPLNDCGSGVGQVLAILYVVLTADYPRVILVDEPQSFLHPGAVRKLIGVLKRFPKHQYIFTTHSPAVITAAEPETILMARANDGETSLRGIDSANTDDLRIYLSELGARLSDVFGADAILWVEGRTEEICFPRILATVANQRLMGTAVVGIKQTGDFQTRDKRRVFEIYQRLSQANTLMPPAVAFLFDSECWSAAQKADLERAGQHLVHFLPRRMYENFLLNVEAITAVINEIEGFSAIPVEQEAVQQLIDRKRAVPEYYCPEQRPIPAEWIAHIDAAKLLSETFGELSENRVSFEKTRHSVAITDWLLTNRPEAFRELADWLKAKIAS